MADKSGTQFPGGENPPPSSAAAERGETVRETIVRSIRESEAAMAKGVPPSINVQALADKAVLGLCEMLALLFGLPFGEDLYNEKSITWLHLFYLAIGLLFAVSGPMWPWVRTRTWLPESVSASFTRAALDARYWLAGLFLIFLFGVAPDVYRRATEPIVPPPAMGFTQQQVDEKIAAATKPLETQIASLKEQKPQLQIGPQEALIISKFFGNPNVLSKDTRWAIFLTYPPENQKFYNTLTALMRDQLNPWILNAPDNSTDLDAPKFPPPPAEPGITLHGDNALNTALSQILAQCFIVRRTDREIDGLMEWFNKRLSEPERAENRKITWIEIGHGSPWLQSNKLSTNCLQ